MSPDSIFATDTEHTVILGDGFAVRWIRVKSDKGLWCPENCNFVIFVRKRGRNKYRLRYPQGQKSTHDSLKGAMVEGTCQIRKAVS